MVVETNLILLYVDDIIVAGSNMEVIDDVKAFLHFKFKLRNLGPVKFFLGLEIARSSLWIVIGQRQYVLQLLKDYGFIDSAS